jgi:hypothetical protein
VQNLKETEPKKLYELIKALNAPVTETEYEATEQEPLEVDALDLQFGFEEETRECVTACTESARRFFTPFFRISLLMWAFTVRSSMPRAAPISLFDRPPTSSSKTSFSRLVRFTRSAGKECPVELFTRSMNMERT